MIYESQFGIVFLPTKENPNPDYSAIEDDERVARRINLRIYKERRNPREKFNPYSFKKAFLAEMEKIEEVDSFLRRTTGFDKQNSWRSGSHLTSGRPSLPVELDRQALQNIKIDNITEENRRIKKKANAVQKLQFYLQEIQKMMNTPNFVKNYFKCKDGQLFTKNNPEKNVS
mmetsp:Transcript_5576/g.4245  ORF Transcript_5576/g.4245 Transcript_5576/m.4245 type:complete len:172 (+) Transcript_5576:3445-3960(+)